MRSVVTLLLTSSLALTGCHASPERAPIEEATTPPLPPSSGTPIGVLIDESARLQLRSDQVDHLREIDLHLQAGDDPEARADATPPAGGPPQGRRGGHHRRSGGGGDGFGGFSGGHGGGWRGDRKRGGDGPGPGSGSGYVPPAADASQERSARVRDAIERAFALLDPAQLETARALLTERGYELPGASPPPAASDEP